MRYISTDPRPVSLSGIEGALKAIDPKYAVKRSVQSVLEETAMLMYGRALYALLEIVRVSETDSDDFAELRSEVEAVAGEVGQRVSRCMEAATDVLVVEVKWQSRSTEATLRRLDPMWDWLNVNRQGLIQADGEGFYEGQTLILDLGSSPRRKKVGRPCPDCGKPLRTQLAKQCLECGADWH